MPELPEVETIRRGLKKRIVGKRIKRVEVLREKSFQGKPQLVVGRRVKAVKRQAKVLMIELEGGWWLLVHLKLTGQLIFRDQKSEAREQRRTRRPTSVFDVTDLPNKYTRVIVEFEDQSRLYFNDLRVFGWMRVVKDEELKSELLKFSGVDPLSSEFTADYLRQIASRFNRPIKLLLMDQKKIAGIGNIYANEALFCAGIRPDRKAAEVVQKWPEKIGKLQECVVKVLKEGIRYGGTTGADEAFRNVEGEWGRMQEHLQVYQREGEQCFRCGAKIKRIKIGGRSSFYCPRCQQ